MREVKFPLVIDRNLLANRICHFRLRDLIFDELHESPHWSEPKNKLFAHQVGFTCPPHDFDAAPSDFLRMAPDSVGVHGRMLHVPDYRHRLDQRKQNFGLLEEFVECMANNGVDVCGQVGSNWVHASWAGGRGYP